MPHKNPMSIEVYGNDEAILVAPNVEYVKLSLSDWYVVYSAEGSF
jgi:hypothetical protein